MSSLLKIHKVVHPDKPLLSFFKAGDNVSVPELKTFDVDLRNEIDS